LSASSSAAARAEPSRTTRTNASSARKGGRRRTGTTKGLPDYGRRVEGESCATRQSWQALVAHFDLLGRVKPQSGDVGFVPGGHFDPPAARMFEDGADFRHLAREDECEAAQRVHVLGHFGEAR